MERKLILAVNLSEHKLIVDKYNTPVAWWYRIGSFKAAQELPACMGISPYSRDKLWNFVPKGVLEPSIFRKRLQPLPFSCSPIPCAYPLAFWQSLGIFSPPILFATHWEVHTRSSKLSLGPGLSKAFQLLIPPLTAASPGWAGGIRRKWEQQLPLILPSG